MLSLFPDVQPKQFPIRTVAPRRNSPRRSFAQHYGPSNPSIFAVELPAPAPYRESAPLMLLAAKDPFGELANLEHEAQASLRAVLLSLPNDYDASVAFIRANRPALPGDGLRFWNGLLPRAHALNALLLRGEKNISQVHADLRLHHDRLYTYMINWGIVWQKLESRAKLQDGSGQTFTVSVAGVDHAAGKARLHLLDYTFELDARYDPINQVFRTSDVLDFTNLLPLDVVAPLVGLTPKFAREVFTSEVASLPRNIPLLSLSEVARVIPEHRWRMTPSDALRGSNPCRCAFFDHHQRACGLGRLLPAQPKDAPMVCDDHAHHA